MLRLHEYENFDALQSALLTQSNRTAERWQLVSLKNAAATPEVAIEAISTRSRL